MDPVARLLARDQYGIKFGLASIEALCAALDHPERAAPTLIVAGTNGKGSVTAMAAAALQAAGYRTARYTSPHLVDLRERFAIDGHPVTTASLKRAVEVVLSAEADCLSRHAMSHPATFFEITTAVAFELFRELKVEATVLEVGMGGRFDATNVADPCAAAISSISFDHMRFLGNTLGEIAFEKAGVSRPGRPLVMGAVPPEAEAVIRRVAEDKGAVLVDALDGVVYASSRSTTGTSRLSLQTPAQDYGSFELGLRGRHQVMNAIVAVRLLEAAQAGGLAVSASAVRKGLSNVSWPARLQQLALSGGRTLLLDAAHNPAGVEALRTFLSDISIARAPIVFGVMCDKDVDAMLNGLVPVAGAFVFTQARSPRAMPADVLAAHARRLGIAVPFVAIPDPLDALEHVWRESAFAVVAGSIFLIGDLLTHLPATAR